LLQYVNTNEGRFAVYILYVKLTWKISITFHDWEYEINRYDTHSTD
jgi:hypothetical protein